MACIGQTVRLPVPRTELDEESVFYIGTKLWNVLSEKVRN